MRLCKVGFFRGIEKTLPRFIKKILSSEENNILLILNIYQQCVNICQEKPDELILKPLHYLKTITIVMFMAQLHLCLNVLHIGTTRIVIRSMLIYKDTKLISLVFRYFLISKRNTYSIRMNLH